METFILLVGLLAAGIGSLVLLLSLAGKRAQLIRAYNIQQEIEERDRLIKENQAHLENSITALESEPETVGAVHE